MFYQCGQFCYRLSAVNEPVNFIISCNIKGKFADQPVCYIRKVDDLIYIRLIRREDIINCLLLPNLNLNSWVGTELKICLVFLLCWNKCQWNNIFYIQVPRQLFFNKFTNGLYIQNRSKTRKWLIWKMQLHNCHCF